MGNWRNSAIASFVAIAACSPVPGPPDGSSPDGCVAQPETCDGLDNDCDGVIDGSQATGPLTPLCTIQVGVCGGARGSCVDGGVVCSASSYGASWEAGETRCDGLDNDCDGNVDRRGDGGTITAPCRLDAGVCAGARATCTNGSFPECGPTEYGPLFDGVERRCDSLDNDCDGVVDQSKWVTSSLGYSVPFDPSGERDPYPWLFATDAGYLAQYGDRLWTIDFDLSPQPATVVPDPTGAAFLAFFPSAIKVRDQFVVMGTAFKPPNIDNFAWRFRADGKVIRSTNGDIDYWLLGQSPGTFTLVAGCAAADGESFVAGTIPGTGAPYLMSISSDGGVLTPAASVGTATSRWTCAAHGTTGFVIAIDNGAATTFTEVDRALTQIPASSARTVSGSCVVERQDTSDAGPAFAVCNRTALLQEIFDGGTPEPLSLTNARVVRAPGVALLRVDESLAGGARRLSLSDARGLAFRTVQTAQSDNPIGVQRGRPGEVILMTSGANSPTVRLSRLCFP